MQRVKLYGALGGPAAVKDLDTGQPVGGVIQRIDLVIEPNKLPLAILTDIKGDLLMVEVGELDLK